MHRLHSNVGQAGGVWGFAVVVPVPDRAGPDGGDRRPPTHALRRCLGRGFGSDETATLKTSALLTRSEFAGLDKAVATKTVVAAVVEDSVDGGCVEEPHPKRHGPTAATVDRAKARYGTGLPRS